MEDDDTLENPELLCSTRLPTADDLRGFLALGGPEVELEGIGVPCNAVVAARVERPYDAASGPA